MNSNFYLLVFTFIAFGCGVKSDPTPPVGSKPLVSIEEQYLYKPTPAENAGSGSGNQRETSKPE